MNREARREPDPLAGSDPVRGSALAGDGIERALNEIGAAIVTVSRPTPRATRSLSPTRIRRIVLVTAAVVAVTAGVATGAVVLGAHTGRFPTKAEEATGGPGEELDPSAPDFRAVAFQA